MIYCFLIKVKYFEACKLKWAPLQIPPTEEMVVWSHWRRSISNLMLNTHLLCPWLVGVGKSGYCVAIIMIPVDSSWGYRLVCLFGGRCVSVTCGRLQGFYCSAFIVQQHSTCARHVRGKCRYTHTLSLSITHTHLLLMVPPHWQAPTIQGHSPSPFLSRTPATDLWLGHLRL